MYEDTQACLCQVFEESLKVLERKVAEADAFLLVTDRPGFQIPSSLATVKHRFTGNNFTWRPYGVQCVLLGGSVHSRKVAMRLRVLLEGSDYPYMSGVLPRRCSWTEMYAVDPSLETPGPCVLWDWFEISRDIRQLSILVMFICSVSLNLSLLYQNFPGFWSCKLKGLVCSSFTLRSHCFSLCYRYP